MRTWPALDVGPLREPDLFQAALLDYDVAAVDETAAPGAWRVFFSSDAGRDTAIQRLSRQFPGVTLQALDVADEDWAARSQAALRAIRVGSIVVAPPWDVPTGSRDQAADRSRDPLVIVIRPSMGFGTGHHATTRLCLGAMQQVDLTGRRVLDVGTGSGVLAIAADRLGAATAVAVDTDPDAIEAALDNLTLNGDAPVSVRQGDIRSMELGRFDVVIANLTGALLIASARRLRQLANPGASLVLSGFMRSEEAAVRDAYAGLDMTRRTEEEEWVCVIVRCA